MAKYKINPHTGRLDRIVDVEGEGLMDKPTYDIDENAIIDKAESIDDGAGNTASASDLKDAVTKKHTQGTDTALGQLIADIDMNNHSLLNLADSSIGFQGGGSLTRADYLRAVEKTSVGLDWTPRSSTVISTNGWYGIAYGNGLFVATGDGASGDAIMTSPDGVNWTGQTVPGTWGWVAYGNGLFVAVGYVSGADRIITSPNGIDWTVRTAINADWREVAYGNGMFVVVGEGGIAMSSPDGINWTSRTIGGGNWQGVTYGNGLFVAVSTNNGVNTSPDGITWTTQSTVGGSNRWRAVAYGNGMFVAVSSYSSNRVMTSPNGIDWTSRTSAHETAQWYGVTYGKGLFVAVAKSYQQIMTSPDGINWTGYYAGVDYQSVRYGNGMFVVVGASGTNRITTSGEIEQYINPHDNVYQGGIDIRGDIEVSGELKEDLSVASGKTIDGRDLSVDGTKLDGIEALAVALATVKADADITDAITHKDLTDNPHEVKVEQLDLASGTIASDVDDAVDKKHVHLITEDTDFVADEVLNTGLGASYGMLVVRESTGGITGLFRLENQTIIIVSAHADFSITKDNADTYNVYWETDQFKVQNKKSGSLDSENLRVGFFGV